MQRIKVSASGLILQKGNNTLEINGGKKLLTGLAAFFVPYITVSFYLPLPAG
jgi:hypothetical protein